MPKTNNRSPLILIKVCLSSVLLAFSAHSQSKSVNSNFYNYGDIHFYMSPDQSKLHSVEFNKNITSSEWVMCTHAITNRLKVIDIKYAWRKEINEFTVHDPKWGNETYPIDLSEVPQAHKWILSTLIQRNQFIKITSRACGSGMVPYLIKIEK